MNWGLLQNSLFVAASTAICGGLAGLAFALFAAALPRMLRAIAVALAIAAFVLPPFLVTNTWMNYFGLTGTWRSWLDFDIYTLRGTIFILALLLWPIAFLFCFAAVQRIDRTYLEQEFRLRGWNLFRYLVWPVTRRSFAEALVIIFVLALNNFSVPALLQTKVFSAEVWLSFNTKFNFGEALQLSWPLILAPLILLALVRTPRTRFAFRFEQFSPALFRERLAALFPLTGIISLFVLVISLAIPAVQLVSSSRTWTEFFPSLEAGRGAVFYSLLFATVPALLVMAIGITLARRRGVLFAWIPLLAPGVVLGIALIWALNRPPFIGFYQSASVVLLGFTIRYFALGWTGARQARAAADPAILDVLSSLGASRWNQFRLAEWPQGKYLLLGAFYITYLLCLWEVETLILIVPPGQETLALRIFNMLHYGHAAQVDALCVWLLVFALIPIAAFALWEARRLRTMLAAVAALFLVSCDSGSATHRSLDSKIFSRVEVIGTRGTGPGQLNKPRSVAVDREDNLYVVDITGRVQKFSPDGKFILFWQMPQTDKGKPKGMLLDNDGSVIVVEPHYSRVNHFDTNGKLLAQWGINGTNAGQLAFPRSIAVNSHGELYLSEYGLAERVQRFTARGERFIQSIGTPGNGPGELNRAEGLGIDSEDRVFVADSCNHRIQIFSRDGKFLEQFGHAGSGPGEFSYPYDVRIDPLGNRFVCEFGNSRIQMFDSQNHLIEIIGGPGGAPGEMSNPWAIALDSRGNLYVADALNHRVQKFIRREPFPPRSGDHTAKAAPAKPLARR